MKGIHSEVTPDREAFYAGFTALLKSIKPESGLPAPMPDTHLWEAGYLDSFALMQVIAHLEQVTGREILLGPDMLSSFFTLSRIYNTYVTVDAQ